eukprot:GHVQ01033216.1.p1 GENE.GHVQ01033216.1~~GHVQ01033216.1.p1  ORF type:complete len:328 (-),score=42.98 GHVQ01033216.1:410-1393(-)
MTRLRNRRITRFYYLLCSAALQSRYMSVMYESKMSQSGTAPSTCGQSDSCSSPASHPNITSTDSGEKSVCDYGPGASACGLLSGSCLVGRTQRKSLAKTHHGSSAVSDGGTSIQSTGSRIRSQKSISWDEKTIALHDQDRGTRMKIDEPNTPFHRADSGQASDEDVDLTSTDTGMEQVDPVMHSASICPLCCASKDQSNHQHPSVCPHALIEQLNKLSGSPALWSFDSANSAARAPLNSSSTTNPSDVHITAEDSRSSSGDRPDGISHVVRSGSSHSESEGEGERRMSFEMRRKAHYNEYQVLKKMRESGSLLISDEEEDNEDDCRA